MGVEARSDCCSRIRSCYSLHLDMRSLVRGAPRAGFAHDLRALRRRCAAVFVVSIIARLHRRARHGPVRAEHAAVSRLRTQHGLASLAFVEELAGLGRHDLPLCVTALGTRDHRFEEDFRHTLTPRSPNAHLQLSHRSGSFCIRGWHHGWLIAVAQGCYLFRGAASGKAPAHRRRYLVESRTPLVLVHLPLDFNRESQCGASVFERYLGRAASAHRL